MQSARTIETIFHDAREHLRSENVDGWLLYDYRGMNPIFSDTLGRIPNVTRPCWLWVPVDGAPTLLASYVDLGRFQEVRVETKVWVSRPQMVNCLANLLRGSRTVAMEYSPDGVLPRVSKVDAGTLEMVRGLGVDVVSSADTVQYATQRWTDDELQSHRVAAMKLDAIVREAFEFIGERLEHEPTERQAADFIRARFLEEGLETEDGPVVAANEHSADPHFEPTPANSFVIRRGDWVLIDLWAKVSGADSMFADITWTGYVGESVPSEYQRVFDVVVGARDTAVAAIAASSGRTYPQGWELDKIARDYIAEAGYAEHFNHRLGHSIGREVHGNAVNLDSWETHDTRRLMPGIATSVEPGVYLPGRFGVRSEIDVFIAPGGPEVTTAQQRAPVLIGP